MDDKYYSSMAASGLTQIASAPAPRQPPLGRIFNAIETLGEAAARARDVGSALAGGQPESPGKSLNPVGNGLFDEMEQAAVRIEAYASGIISDMQRIKDRL